MPDPILALADLESPAPFNIGGIKGQVFPQFLEAGSKLRHTNMFYVEFPADHSGSFYQIQGSTLVAVIGDGGINRHFKAYDIAKIMSYLSTKLNHRAFLNSISIPFAH